jgi:hypothetical protein
MSSETFYPYSTAPEGITLTLEMSDPDVRRRPEGFWDATDPLVDEIKMGVTFDLADDLLETVLPAAETSRPPVAMLVTGTSLEARRRQAWRFDWSQATTEAVELVLRRSEWVGMAEIQAVMVRTRESTKPEDGYAVAASSRLAWSAVEKVAFDEPPDLPPGGRLEIKWMKFSEGNEWLRRSRSQLFALEYAELPRLLLNEDVQSAKIILHSAGTHGRRPRIRDATFMQIAHQTWSSLLATSLAELGGAVRDDNDADPASLFSEITEWRAAVLRDWARWLYPEEGDQDGAIARLIEQIRIPGMDDLLMRRLPYAISQRLETWKGFVGLAREFGVAIPEGVASTDAN